MPHLPGASPALLLAVLLSVPCAGALPAHAASADGMAMSPHPPSGSAADAAMMAGMTRMKHAMATAPMTGDADRDFVAMMVPHHAGAIDMAEVELRYGKDPALRRLAQDIVTAQKREIAQMHRWTASHPAR